MADADTPRHHRVIQPSSEPFTAPTMADSASPTLSTNLAMNTTSADGHQAESNEEPPPSKHGQLPTVPEWAPQNLDVEPGIRVYDGVYDDGVNDEYPLNEYFEPDMKVYNDLLTMNLPPGFVDPSLIHPGSFTSMTIHPQECSTPSLYSASPTITPSPQTSTGSPAFLPCGTSFAPAYFQPPVDPSEQKRSSVSFQSSYSGEGNQENREKMRCSWPDCGKVFKDLRAHMLAHQNERPEKCPILTCDFHTKGFARKYDKNRHTLTHYKGTMVCGFCPGSGSAAEKSFKRADVFKRHLTAVHGVEQTLPHRRKNSAANTNEKLTGYASDATGNCSTCSQTFTNAQDFYEHLDDCVLRIVQQEGPVEANPAGEVQNSSGLTDSPSGVSLLGEIPTELQIPIDVFPSAVGEDESPEAQPKRMVGLEDTHWRKNVGDRESAPADMKKLEEANVIEAPAKDFVDDEIPYTDSGYASCTNPGGNPNALLKPYELVPAIRQDEDEEDARTTYSGATSVDQANAQNYITELSHHIQNNLQHHIDSAGRSELRGSLPELIKAFAIKIGCEKPSQLNRDVMYFVHKHHREIATEIERLLLDTDDDVSGDARKADPDGMSLLDKMNMWENNARVDVLENDQGELFDGVEDQEEETISPEEVPRYNKIILDSSAYCWLITNFRKACSLQRGATELRLAVDDIRQTVLDKLPSGRISKRIVPPRQHCTFRLLLAPLKARIYRAYDVVQSRCALPTSISEVVTVTCSSDEAQAITVREYFAQTWPSAGSVLLEVLEQVLGRSDRVRHQAMLSDTTGIAAQTHGSHLFVTVDGQAYSIVECAEQLAWLASAIQPPRNKSVTSCRPFITTPSIPMLDFSLDGQILRDGNSSQTSLGGGQALNDGDVGSRQSHWRTKSLAPGEPDPVQRMHYPVNDAGKAPYPPTQSPRVLAFDINVIEEGVTATHSKQEPSWHRLLGDIIAVHGFATTRRPESCPGLELPFSLLLEAAGASGTTVLDGFHFLKGSRIHLKMAKRLHNVFYWQEIYDVTGSSHGTTNSLGHGPDWVNLATISKADLETGRHIVCDGKSTPSDIADEVDSISTHTVSVVDTPLTDDILSIPSASEDVDYPEQNRIGFRFFKRLLSRLVLALQADAEAKTKNGVGAGGEATGSSTQGAPNVSSTASSLTTLEPRRKRPRENDGSSGDEGNNEDGGDGRQPKRPRAHQPNYPVRSKYLACPFWKLDPDKHRICLFKKLTAISYVKQHLVRQHTPAFYCATCFMVFEDFSSYDYHAVERTCQRSPTAKLEGISHDKNKQLRRKSKPGPVQVQWLAIWRVLFPDRPQPSSVYVDSDLSEDFCLLREFSQRHGVPIMLEQLRSDGLTPRLGVSERELQETLRRGMDAIFERFHLDRPSGSPTSVGDLPEMSPDSLAPEETPTASSADSGVAMRSHSSQYSSRAMDVVPLPWNIAGTITLEEEAMGQLPDDPAGMSSILDNGSWDSMGDDSQLVNFDILFANICS